MVEEEEAEVAEEVVEDKAMDMGQATVATDGFQGVLPQNRSMYPHLVEGEAQRT